MELQITGKNIELSPAVRDYIERKLGKLNRHLPNIIESKVEITKEKTKSPQQHYVVQVTVNSKGTLLRGEERAEDLFAAVDKVVDIMDRQIEHFKGKRFSKGRGTSFARGVVSQPVEAETEAEEISRVTRVKRFAINPMSVDEAIDQMELLGHDFFLFFNTEEKELNLVYRRRDGNYGLIQPVLS
jgi:putative sigma-54 modulation protein